MKLPWYDGNVEGVTKVWDADGNEVDLYRYSALIVDAVNRRHPIQALLGDIANWLRSKR